jgi:hypothetical protein
VDVIKQITNHDGEPEKIHTEVFPFAGIHLDLRFGSQERLSQRAIINTLNQLHFSGKSTFAHMTFKSTGEEFLVQIKPEPCINEHFSCLLPQSTSFDFSHFTFKNLIIDDGKNILLIPGKMESISKERLKMVLPTSGTILGTRQAKRFQSSFINVELNAHAHEINGTLHDFSASGLRVVLNKEFERYDALSIDDHIKIVLRRGDRVVYSGPGIIKRISARFHSVVIIPSRDPQLKYVQRVYRHKRLKISPTPRVEFYHPIMDRIVAYDILDLNTAGFSIQERSERLLFLPGMSFEHVNLVFSGEFKLAFSARAVYMKDLRHNMAQIGFSITDIDPSDYRRLFNVITRADDPHSLALSKVSVDSLWDFFFKSGFIYPEKYRCISRSQKHFQRIYEKLYNECHDLFVGLTYQQNDEIYGHVSLFKAYPRAWMVQHLAAIPMGKKRTGLYVLNNILDFLDGFHRMKSVGMDYLIFNYRPENKFPNFFFSGVYRTLNAPHMCSIDTSAYVMYQVPQTLKDLPAGWNLRPCEEKDIQHLHEAYHKHSPGLLIDSFCLDKRDDPVFFETYRKYGLKRSVTPYVLQKDGTDKAFFIVERSDRGLNLSDLLNSIRIFLPDTSPEFMPREILQIALSYLGQEYNSPEIVLQIFPVEYCTKAGINFKKRYTVWIASTGYFDPYFDAIRKMTKFKYIKYVKSRIFDMLGLHNK